jgi:uncharacterized phage-associated protein
MSSAARRGIGDVHVLGRTVLGIGPVLITHDRQKLIDAIVFFAENTKYCGKVKIFKLLYLLDFAHFRETGRSVTGLDYQAWKLGPVPQDLAQEWFELEPDLAEAIEIIPQKVIDYTRELVVPRRKFQDELFTKRELRLMQELAQRFREDTSMPLVNVTHAERGPWDKIWDSGKGRNERIPYGLSVPDDDPHRDVILESAKEYEGIRSGLTTSH